MRQAGEKPLNRQSARAIFTVLGRRDAFIGPEDA
jgi:hypothetical protein